MRLIRTEKFCQVVDVGVHDRDVEEAQDRADEESADHRIRKKDELIPELSHHFGERFSLKLLQSVECGESAFSELSVQI